MTEIMLKIPVGLASDPMGELQSALSPFAEVYESPAKSYDFTTLVLIVSFSANALQVVDILADWLKRRTRGNQAEIRLADGRTFKLETNTGPDDFVKQLRAALKDL